MLMMILLFFDVNNVTDSFSFKVKFTGQTRNNGRKNFEIMVPLKYLSSFWRNLQSYFNMVSWLCSYCYWRSKPKCNICNN